MGNVGYNAPLPNYTNINTELNTCNTNLNTYKTDLNTCKTNLNTCKTELDTSKINYGNIKNKLNMNDCNCKKPRLRKLQDNNKSPINITTLNYEPRSDLLCGYIDDSPGQGKVFVKSDCSLPKQRQSDMAKPAVMPTQMSASIYNPFSCINKDGTLNNAMLQLESKYIPENNTITGNKVWKQINCNTARKLQDNKESLLIKQPPKIIKPLL